MQKINCSSCQDDRHFSSDQALFRILNKYIDVPVISMVEEIDLWNRVMNITPSALFFLS